MQSVKNFFPQHGGYLTLRLAQHQRLLAEARRVLPSYLRGYCQLCWINSRNQLVLQAAGQGHAAQIRFFLVAIVEAVRKATSGEVSQVMICTAVPDVRVTPQLPVATPASAQLLKEEASASGVPEIGEALSRLAVSVAGRCKSMEPIMPSQP